MTRRRHHKGFTILELLVTLTVIGLLLALLLPAVQSARESSRRIDCASRMRQVSLAVLHYSETHNSYPSGIGFKYTILPYLGETAIYNARIQAPSPGNDGFDPIKNAAISAYHCPSDALGAANVTGRANVAGCSGAGSLNYGQNGFFTIPDLGGRWVRPSDILNGHSNVTMLSEFLVGIGDMNRLLRTNYNTVQEYGPGELDNIAAFCAAIPESPVSYGYTGVSIVRGHPWYDGNFGHGLYNHALTPNQPGCSNNGHLATGVYAPTSAHPGGVNVLFADGHGEFVSNSVDLSVWRKLGSRTSQVVTN